VDSFYAGGKDSKVYAERNRRITHLYDQNNTGQTAIRSAFIYELLN
jgi:hypothetical protein